MVAAFLMNRPDERETAPQMIETRRAVDMAKLADETIPAADWAKAC